MDISGSLVRVQLEAFETSWLMKVSETAGVSDGPVAQPGLEHYADNFNQARRGLQFKSEQAHFYYG